MECLITSEVGDAMQVLEKTGYLAEPTDQDNIFSFVVESVEELFHLADIIGYNVIVTGGLNNPMLIIANK
jgi:hypothetical protein